MNRFLAALGFATLASVYAAAGIAAVTVATVGPWLAMGLRMYATGDTEPREPQLAWPWIATVLCVLAPAPLAWKGRWAWATVASAPFFLLPWVQLYRLYART